MEQPSTPTVSRRYFPDYVPEAHLGAIRQLNGLLLSWQKGCDDIIAGSHEELYVSACEESLYAGTAISHALVGAMAPFYEGMFWHEFEFIRYLFAGKRPPAENHRRRSNLEIDDDFWNPAVYVDKKGQRGKDNIVCGTFQLLDSLNIRNRFGNVFERIVEALFAYRNFALHAGYEWTVDRRKTFQDRIERERWGGWFEWATSGGEPWVVTMTDAFVTECLLIAETAKDVFEKYRQEIVFSPPIPDYLKQFSNELDSTVSDITR